jgi:uncharacterized pyridoxamine 5'-phosphate oxidase family protein
MAAKNKAELCAFMQSHRLAVLATADRHGRPEAALVDVAVTDGLEIIFETTSETRKIRNLQENPRISFVIGWADNQTLQYDGVVDQPGAGELERIVRYYLSVFPEKLSHRAWPGNFYFRARPLWIRYSDYHSPRSVEEHQFPAPPGNEPANHRFSFARLIGR